MTSINAILTDGQNVDMPALRSYLADMEATMAQANLVLATGTVSALVGTRTYATQAALYADLVPADDLFALVYADADPLKNGLYQKDGATTAGDWDGPFDLFASAAEALVQPLVDDAADAAAAAAASASAATAALGISTLALGRFVNQQVVLEPGAYNKSTGGDLDPPTYAVWNRWELAVSEGQVLRLAALMAGEITALVSFFDGGGAIVGSPVNPGVNGVFTRYDGVEVAVPANAVLAKGTGYGTATEGKSSLIIVERASLESDRAEEVASQVNALPFVEQAVSLEDGYYSAGGVFNGDSAWKHQVFAIKPGQYVRVENLTTNGADQAAIVFGTDYDSGTKSIGSVTGAFNSGGAFQTPVAPVPRRAPDGTSHVAVTTFGPRAIRVFISDISASFGRDVSDTIAILNPCRGKTAVVFGTSITIGGGVIGSHWDVIGPALGLSITNEGIASSTARGGVAARRGTGDTYGWTGVYWRNLFVSMGKSLAECDDLIANWGSKWDSLLQDRDGDMPSAPLSSELQAQIIASSYETILDRHLGDGNRKDLYIFEHGINDHGMANQSWSSPGVASGLNDMTTVPGTRFDRATYIGAMEFYFNRIWADNPRARIILIGHFDNQVLTANAAAGQEALAARVNLPLLKLWDQVGWSNFEIVGGPADGQSAYEFWLPDGIHPYSDTSGQARDRLVSIIGRWLAAIA